LSGEIITTVVGNLADDPELRFITDGTAVCKFRLANTPRVRNANGDWQDGEPTWVNVTCWRGLAENVAETLKRGSRAIAYGKLENRPYDDKEGVKRYSLDLTAEACGPDLTFATATITKTGGAGKKAPPRADAFEGASTERPTARSQDVPPAQAQPAAAASSRRSW